MVQKFPGTARYSSTERPPDQRHKSLVLVNTYIHPGAASIKASWDFLEQIEDDLEDTTVMYDDFNARSSMWD